ncbi:SDR family oxidoreductase [Acinetobacter terrae]|jgi:NAD(P)-dependent dehydrogenase (short-subunit alcohol dehydrogenase family)|uniref:SDR family oxidoreductase n=1 Tax=Acinetobacter terrae TaxID=2731247 RepID=A0A241VAE8_9GAMM|nr:SDR family oxidoreductase [Acinetobacter terrae]NNH79287.1 SDR family oxidoreductase [Acinetobacter terrae]OAL82645.1 3-ketoacyl-ACP reductase [Acinetobacter terrae]OTG72834.1 3-oxoacyl-[acyl-carrier-protein] reductase [Acinetobacter terrae]TCB53263.1 SDR family oxidoreductase [Acinetobacter terrae]
MTQQKVLISAGASGIGKAIAENFLKHGAKVCIIDINQQALDAFQQEQPDILAFSADLSSLIDLERVFQNAIQALGGELDVLINNTGISGPTMPMHELDIQKWNKVIQINLNSTFRLTQLVIPYLQQSENAAIVNMSSAAGRFGYPNRIAYSTTKWGLVGFTKTLAMELGKFNIRVNAIAPGAVDGPRFQGVLAQRAAVSGRTLQEETMDALAVQSLKYMVNPQHIGELAYFLASEAGRSISGQLIPIDGDTQNVG